MKNIKELNSHELLKYINELKEKHESLKKTILEKTIENEKLIGELYSIENEYKEIAKKLNFINNEVNE